MSSVLQRIRQAILEERYVFTTHAHDERRKDGFTVEDALHAILSGRMVKRLTRDVRGTRYCIEGQSRNGRWMHAICRFDELEEILIITVYAQRR